MLVHAIITEGLRQWAERIAGYFALLLGDGERATVESVKETGGW